MAQLWGGRFTKETDQLVYEFNQSIRFDQRFFAQDVRGSRAHVTMLAKQGILTEEERDEILRGLQSIEEDVAAGKLVISDQYEDIHSFVEAVLTERIGDPGKKLHTGRSRNDQVALDMRLYIRDEVDETVELLKNLLGTILRIMEENTETYMPGFTHLQKAQPVTLAHHMGAYFEMVKRDVLHLKSLRERMNVCPLGSGALAGTTYPLDREYTAKLLGFDRASDNSMDGVSANEYRFIELDDTYATGSSIMPQKKNPDIAELIRGKTGRVYGAMTQILTIMKGIPLAYNKDMQEDKETVFDAIDTTKGCIRLMEGQLASAKWNKKRMADSARQGYSNATDAADYLVKKGMPFRDAHSVIGRLVLTCIEKNIQMDELPLADYRAESELFDEDIYEAISLKTCVETRITKGAPGDIENEIRESRAFMAAL